MKSNSSTLAQPSPDSLDSRKEELFEMFVIFLEGIGGVENLVISDEMIMNDLEYAAERWGGFEADVVTQLPSRPQRMVLLKRAKRAALRLYFQEYIDGIADRRQEIDQLDGEEKSELFDVETIEWDLANYLPDFIGRPASFRRDHAWLLAPGRRFFGEPLSPHYVRHWSRQLLAAAGLTNPSVVYFVSLADPAEVKIGVTGNFAHRLRSFRTASPVEPQVHLLIVGDRRLEAELHQHFKADHVAREWFRLSPAIAAFIAEKTEGDSEKR
jgi:hypothetical protein